MEKLLTYLLKEMLGKEKFEVKEELTGDFSKLTIIAPKESIGLIIGKGGNTIKALRNILKIKATLEKKGVSVEVTEKI
jgi:predicted RNA-binding protein YlqC (UPF0109 family)